MLQYFPWKKVYINKFCIFQDCEKKVKSVKKIYISKVLLLEGKCQKLFSNLKAALF